MNFCDINHSSLSYLLFALVSLCRDESTKARLHLFGGKNVDKASDRVMLVVAVIAREGHKSAVKLSRIWKVRFGFFWILKCRQHVHDMRHIFLVALRHRQWLFCLEWKTSQTIFPPRLSSQTLTDEILREDSESKLCNQQVDDVSVVLGAHQLFHIDRNDDEDDARAEAADDARTNQNFKCASAMKTEQVGN